MAKRKRLEKTVWVPCPDFGFDLQLRYLPRGEQRQMIERATEILYDPKSGRNLDRIDPEGLNRELAGVILNWREAGRHGVLSRQTFARLIPIDPADYPEEIPCTEEYKLELLDEVRGFDTVVLQLCTSLARFQDEKVEAETANL